MITRMMYRDYDENKTHNKYFMKLSKALDVAFDMYEDHPQSIVVIHGDSMYTVYITDKGAETVERL